MPHPGAVHITLVYLRNKVLDTTVSKKGPPKIVFKQAMPQCTRASSRTQPLPTPREEQQRKWDERKLAEFLDTQESTNLERDVYAQESDKEKEEKSPPHPKKHKKKAKVVKSKEYKIQQPKKRAIIRKCSLCSEKFSSQKELNGHIAGYHKYKFLCSDRKCGKTFGSSESLKKHKLHHGEMTFLCQVCRAKFPFASDLSNHKALHLQEKNLFVHI